MKKVTDIHPKVLTAFRRGTVIPAQVLALDERRSFSPRHQRALTRYYIDSGVGGIAVGVHSTQFAIRDPKHGLFETVMSQTSHFIDEWCQRTGRKILKVGGVCGATLQALREATFESENGYDAALVSLTALKDDGIAAMLSHCRKISQVMPIIGFYLQPAAGGCVLPYEFWEGFFQIENILAVKIAPFNRYRTIDVIRALAQSGRGDIALYTGNDDNLLIDLLTDFRVGGRLLRICGGLLGHWSVWTRKAVELLDELHRLAGSGHAIPAELLTRSAQITDCNAAFFDAANGFAGCIPGLHEVLRRQGLLPGIWCLDPGEVLSPGQYEEISRVYRDYPFLNDDAFVAANLGKWLAD